MYVVYAMQAARGTEEGKRGAGRRASRGRGAPRGAAAAGARRERLVEAPADKRARPFMCDDSLVGSEHHVGLPVVEGKGSRDAFPGLRGMGSLALAWGVDSEVVVCGGSVRSMQALERQVGRAQRMVRLVIHGQLYSKHHVELFSAAK
jgi:hypothetical protein